MIKCPNCGKKVYSDDRFCSGCGKELPIRQLLVTAAMEGDEDAYTALFNLAEKPVRMTVYSILSPTGANIPDADDVVLESMLKGFNSLSTLKEPDAFVGWMRTIARNKAIDYLRKNKAVTFSELSPAEQDDNDLEFEDTLVNEDESADPALSLDNKAKAELLHDMLERLPAEQRTVLVMYYYHRMKISEIAQELGCSEATVKSRLKYGKAKVESSVKELEKKYDIKLYSISPALLLLILFRGGEEALRSSASLQHMVRVGSELGKAAPSGNTAGSGSGESGQSAGSGENAAESAFDSGKIEGGTENTAGSADMEESVSGSRTPHADTVSIEESAARSTSSARNIGSTLKASAAAGAKAASGTGAVKLAAIIAAGILAAGAVVGTAVTAAKKSRESAAEPPAEVISASEDSILPEPQSEAAPEEVQAEEAPVHVTLLPTQCAEICSGSLTTTQYDANGNMILQLTENGTTAVIYTYDENGCPVSAVEYGPNGTFNITYTSEEGHITHLSRVSADGSSNLSYESDFTYTLRDDGQIAEMTETQNWSWGAVVTKTTDYSYNEAGDCTGEETAYSGEYDISRETWTYELNENGERTTGTHEILYRSDETVASTADFTYSDPSAMTLSQPYDASVIIGTWVVNADYTHNYSVYSAGNLIFQNTMHLYKGSFTFNTDGTCYIVMYYTYNGAEQSTDGTMNYTVNGNVVTLTDMDFTFIVLWDGTQWIMAVPTGERVLTPEN